MVDTTDKTLQLKASSSYKFPPKSEVAVGGGKLIEITDGGDTFQLWTKKIDSHTGNNADNTNHVLLLHGGPGCNSQYFECFESFLPQNGYSLYYYNQLDSVFSTTLNDEQRKRMWSIEKYTDHIEAVRKGLGIDKLTVLGHSWGGMLAYEYGIRYPDHLHRLIISNMVPSSESYEPYIATLREKNIPAEINEKMYEFERKEDFASKEYDDLAKQYFYSKHICKVTPWPEPVARSFTQNNMPIYLYFQGANEMLNRGAFRNWTVLDKLHLIKSKTLLMAAADDSMDPQEMIDAAQKMPNAQAWLSETGSHLAMYDDQQNYFTALLSFLDQK